MEVSLQKKGITWGDPIRRVVVDWGLDLGSPIYGKYHVGIAIIVFGSGI